MTTPRITIERLVQDPAVIKEIKDAEHDVEQYLAQGASSSIDAHIIAACYKSMSAPGKDAVKNTILQSAYAGDEQTEANATHLGSILGMSELASKIASTLRHNLYYAEQPMTTDLLAKYIVAAGTLGCKNAKDVIEAYVPQLPHCALVALSQIDYARALSLIGAHQTTLPDPIDTLATMFVHRIEHIGLTRFNAEQARYPPRFGLDPKTVNHAAKDSFRHVTEGH